MTKYIGPKTDGANVATQSDVGGSSLSDATPDALTPDQAGAAGTANAAARADHAHEILCAAAGAILPDDVAAEGTASSFARSDHTHSIATAVPGTITPDAAAAEGSSTSFARADHTHAITAAAPSANLTASTTNTEGTATSFARSDHTHAIAAASAGTITGTNAEGTSTSFARADHNHALGTDVVGSAQIAADAVGSSEIAASAVGTSQLSDSAVTTAKLASGVAIPTGSVMPYAGTAAPTGWLLCDGSEQAVSTYSALDSVLGTTYGSRTNGSGGAGSTHFRLPDLRGRIPAGKDDMGGSAASRLTSTVLTASNTLGATGGTQTHTLATSEMPSHSHNGPGTDNKVSGPDMTVGWANSAGGSGWNPATKNGTLSNTGGGGAHTNTQPTLVLNYIIKT